MYEKIKAIIRVKRWFISLFVLLFVTDVAIILDIPVLRLILGVISFNILPGYLIIKILNIYKTQILTKFLVSVGLSLSFLIFTGLIINNSLLLFGFQTPLSTLSLTISFSIIIFILFFVAYQKVQDDVFIPHLIFQIDNRNQFFSLPIFSLLLPLISVLGIYEMNVSKNNVLLIITLILIPIYVIILIYSSKKIPKFTYPIAIWMISISLLLMRGLPSDYMMGVDIYEEYQAFKVVSINHYWSISNYHNELTAALSSSLLPSVYQSLFGIDEFIIFKLLYPLIISIIPLICYVLLKKYLEPRFAFLSSFFFMSQLSFQFSGIWEGVRVGIGILFFALSMMVFFDAGIDEFNRRILFLIFIISVLVSYYSAIYIFFILIFFVWLINRLLKLIFKSKSNITSTSILLLFAMIFAWWSQITNTSFTSGIYFFENVFTSLNKLFVQELRHETTTYIYNVPQDSLLPQTVTIIIHDISFLFIIFGVLSLLKKYKKTKFDQDYLLMMLVMLGLLASMIILPSVSNSFGSDKLYQMSLIILAPAFVIGGCNIFKYICPKFSLVVVLFVLTLQFFAASLMIYQFFGVSFSPMLNNEGNGHDLYYIYDQEVRASRWIIEYKGSDMIYLDTLVPKGIIMLGNWQQDVSKNISKNILVYAKAQFFKRNESIEHGYIFLRHANVVNGLVYNAGFFEAGVTITNYSHVFKNKGIIYSNGDSKIYT